MAKTKTNPLLLPSGKKCSVCQTDIPIGRLKAVPGTTECSLHSKISPVYGHTFCQGNVDDGYTDISIIADPGVVSQIEQLKRMF